MTFAMFGRSSFPGATCMVCGVDVWDVERYVTAGAVRMCGACVETLHEEMSSSDVQGEIVVVIPPKVHGPVPDDEAPAAVAEAFIVTFGSQYEVTDEHLEDAEELVPALLDARSRFGGGNTVFAARVNAIRFPRNDYAEVRFEILMNGAPVRAAQGSARRHDQGWRVTRETVTDALSGVGVHVSAARRHDRP